MRQEAPEHASVFVCTYMRVCGSQRSILDLVLQVLSMLLFVVGAVAFFSEARSFIGFELAN